MNENKWSTLKNLTIDNTNNIDIRHMLNRKNVSEQRIISRINPDEEDLLNFKGSCFENKRLCVLIQHFDNFRSVYDERVNNFNNINYDTFNILYQVYFPLTILKDVYTHYDLHANNVFLYKPYEGNKYIQMRYHLLSGRIIEFPSEYIVKIIDYGRNYFNNGMTNTTKILNNYVCKASHCRPDCGFDVGYAVIQGDEDDSDAEFSWIFPNKKNISHDLRFANYFYDKLKAINMFDTFEYGGVEGKKQILKKDGTPEKLGGDSRNIYNIVNFRDSLELFIDTWNGQKMIKKYDATWQKKAIMNIYEDKRPYTFEVLPDNV
jgi:hypothetical protein